MARTDDVRGMKARGWVAIVAGAFIVVLMSGIWLFVARAIAEHRMTNIDSNAATFLGQMFVAFALVIVSGFLGIANGITQIRTGCPNRVLTVGTLVAVIAAAGTIAVGLSMHHD